MHTQSNSREHAEGRTRDGVHHEPTTSSLSTTLDNQAHEITTKIRDVSQQIPSSAFLGLAVASIVTSATFQALGMGSASKFVGQWAPTILMMGIYQKLVIGEGASTASALRHS